MLRGVKNAPALLAATKFAHGEYYVAKELPQNHFTQYDMVEENIFCCGGAKTVAAQEGATFSQVPINMQR